MSLMTFRYFVDSMGIFLNQMMSVPDWFWQLMYMGYFVLSTLVIPTMGGVHQWNVRVRDMITILYVCVPLCLIWKLRDLKLIETWQYYNIAAIIYGVVIAAVKLSLLLQYLEIFMPIRNYDFMVVVTYIIIGSNLIFYLACTFFEIFACTPREMFWNRLITNGHCFNMDAINISSATINCISDFVILLLPQGVIWRLQITFRRKLGISAMFLTGLLYVCPYHFADVLTYPLVLELVLRPSSAFITLSELLRQET